jgi:hypothetical protein
MTEVTRNPDDIVIPEGSRIQERRTSELDLERGGEPPSAAPRRR